MGQRVKAKCLQNNLVIYSYYGNIASIHPVGKKSSTNIFNDPKCDYN